jgi:NDP-sugar pyrophosphorylase family protein
MTPDPQIVIPMSGFGERFRRAGYAVPKPLVEIDGLPVVAHVARMFPGERDFLFICNQEHLDEPAYRMRETLGSICPQGRIAGIAPHRRGPVHAVLQVAGMLDPARPVVVNYCDFTCDWSWPDFKRFVAASRCDGAIPAYRGFHPHSLGSTQYAYLRETGGWVEDVREKQPFTADRMREFASSGSYYFSSAALMLRAFAACVAQDLQVGGEYYVSLAYKPLLAEGARVAVYELRHFMQWGTPEDVAEYRYWSGAFERLAREPPPPQGAGLNLVPMAGAGERFRREGYAQPKPLIEVSGAPMFLQALADLPRAPRTRIVLRADDPARDAVASALARSARGAEVRLLPGKTDGQARSCALALDAADGSQPLTIGACDAGVLYDRRAMAAQLARDDWDVLVWGVRGHPPAARHPRQYGWIDADAAGAVRSVSVKAPLAQPANDPVVTGHFTFRRAADFLACAQRLFARDGRVGGEFYVDSCINDAVALGLRCRLFEADFYLCWGTPDELRTFNYWQACFDGWDSHPYRTGSDRHVAAERAA